MKQTILTLTVVLFPLFSYSQKNISNAVVKIETEKEVGTGIIVGQDGPTIYIVTAAHVVMEKKGFQELPSSSIQITLANQDQYVASFLNKHPRDLDLALLKATVSIENQAYYFRPAKEDKLKNGLSINAIGYPNGQYMHKTGSNTLQTSSVTDIRKFKFNSAGAIEGGYSGGLVTQKNGKRIIGMIVKNEGGAEVEGIGIKTLTKWLDDNGIPRTFIKDKYFLEPGTWGLSSLSIAAALTGIYCHGKSDEYYETYSTSRDETAPSYGEVSRDKTLNKAKTHRTCAIIGYGVAGVSALVAFLTEHKPFKQLFKKENSLRGSNIQLKSSEKNQIGILVNF